MEKTKGILYLCATPIGNMEDMTYRGVRILKEASLIAAEDTRRTRGLLAHYDIHTPLTSYHEHNKRAKEPEIMGRLLRGETVVCVSDAGLPGVADPGSDLVKLAIEAGIDVSPLPGANAALSALICSGLSAESFTFIGFLPKKKKNRLELLSKLKNRKETLIFYEAPHHLSNTLDELASVFGDERKAVIARELTKKFEEFLRKTLGELREYFTQTSPRGEFVILLEGDSVEEENHRDVLKDAAPCYKKYLQMLNDKKEAMRQAAKELGVSRREIYDLVLKLEE